MIKRLNGFINVDELLKEIGIKDTSISSLKFESRIKRIGNFYDEYIHFSFDYNGENYFYKYNKGVLLYNELVAEEIAKDFNIPCVSYDLAILNGFKGVISRNYKKNNVKYINALTLLENSFNGYYEIDLDLDKYNNLDSIWTFLDYCYKDRENKLDITHHLMKQIVNMFLFDILSCQYDRHLLNWEIMEEQDNINTSLLFDNERILKYTGDDATVSMSISEVEDENLWEALQKFQYLSSDEFSNLMSQKLWIISEENLIKIFERIEKKTKHFMPKEYKNFYLDRYKKHKEKLEEIIDNKSIKSESSRIRK